MITTIIQNSQFKIHNSKFTIHNYDYHCWKNIQLEKSRVKAQIKKFNVQISKFKG